MTKAKTRAELVLAALGVEVRSSRGRRAWIDCPFHADPEDRECFVRIAGERAGTFHCFSCKEGGALWRVAEKLRGFSEEKAREFVRELGKGFRPERVRAKVVDRSAIARRVFRLPRGIIFDPLDRWVSDARVYAASRGIDQAAVDEYGIGYALDGGHLQGRIVFPAFDARRRPVSYSARTFVGDEKKYVTPADEERPDKDAIFGLHLWRPVGERTVLTLTEGAIDAYSARRASGFDSGSLSGSDVRPRHVAAMSTFRVVVVMTDADASGDLAWRKIQASGLGRWVDLRRLRLAGEDANALMMRRPAELADRIARAAS